MNRGVGGALDTTERRGGPWMNRSGRSPWILLRSVSLGGTAGDERRGNPASGDVKFERGPAAAHYSSTAEILNRLRAEIEAPSYLRYVRLQALPRRFWREFLGDRNWVPLKMILLAALFLLASVI